MVTCHYINTEEDLSLKKSMISMLLTGVVAVSLMGCGGSKDASGTTAATTAATEAASEKETSVEAATEATTVATTGNTFIVGFDQDFPPMGFVGDNGEYTGFDLELAQEVAKRLGLEYKPQPIAWDAKDMELNSGTIDCIWNGFTMNGREDAYAWSTPYMDNSQVFVVQKDSGITALADLTGKIVEVQADSSAEAALKDNTELAGTFGTIQTTPDYNTAFMDLEMGAVDAIAMDVIVAGYQIENREDKDNYVILEEKLASEQYGIGFKKGNEALRDNVNAALKDMAADGTLKTISEKWFGVDVTTIAK